MFTRKVAVAAVPLSQLHYHFGSKQQLILSLLDGRGAECGQLNR
jgi:AcrR family transcriptional regulator